MKNKVITAILGCVMVISIGLNVYFIWKISSTNKQVEVYSSAVMVADDRLNDLQQQLSDLQADLEESNKQIGILTDTLTEREAQIQSLEDMISGYEVEITDDSDKENIVLEGNGAGEGAEIPEDFPYVDREIKQQQQEVVVEQPKQEEVKQDPVVEQPAQSANPPAGLGSMGTFQDLFGSDSSGIGDGSGANGHFGGVE